MRLVEQRNVAFKINKSVNIIKMTTFISHGQGKTKANDTKQQTILRMQNKRLR